MAGLRGHIDFDPITGARIHISVSDGDSSIIKIISSADYSPVVLHTKQLGTRVSPYIWGGLM